MIQLRTLGPLELRDTQGETLDPVLAQPKRLALLAYLALARPRGFQRRDVLLALFWPESDTAHAREALNQAIRFLRRRLGSDVLCSRGQDEIGVDSSRVWCDVVAYEERIAAGADREALALYQGELLEGLFLSEAPLFERWLDAERSRLQELARGAAWRLAAGCEADGDLGGAVHWARRALASAPYDEAAFRRLLELLDRSGDRASAVREYEVFATRLRDELEVEPSPETQSAVEGIRARATPNELPRLAPAARPVAAVPIDVVSEGDVAPTPHRRRRVPGIGSLAAAGALLLLAGGAVAIAAARGDDLEPRRILVIPFENQTRDTSLEPVGKIAADWIVQGLARTDVVEVVPSLQALQLLRDLPEEARSQSAADRTRALAQEVGASIAVVGSYYPRGSDLEFQAQVIDVRRGRLLHAVDGVRAPQSDPMPAIDELRRRTVGAVAFQFDARLPGMQTALRAPSYEAYQAFAAGLDERGRMRWQQSLDYFLQAFALDTSFTPALFMAALESLNLRAHAQADSLIRLLAASRERLPALERLLLQWAEAEVRGDRVGALEAARALDRFSEGFDAQVVLNALSANRPHETIEASDAIDIDAQRHPMWQLASRRRLTDALHRIESHARELAEAKRARQRHPDVVEPVLWEMRALIALGRVQHARERLDEALDMAPDTNWSGGEIMLRAADELRAHGQEREACEVLLRALAWYRVLPDSQATLLRHRRYHAATLLRADSLHAAEAAFRALAAELPDDPYYSASVAVALARRGDHRAATAIADSVLNTNRPYDYGHHVYERARIAAQLGNADRAIELLRRAFADGFDFAFVGGSRVATAAKSPDGSPHLDPAFDALRAHPGFQELARGRN
ncbi:MAG: BTAD domain-containing putative transcriptional regulator [Longimicrobiales bacterium]